MHSLPLSYILPQLSRVFFVVFILLFYLGVSRLTVAILGDFYEHHVSAPELEEKLEQKVGPVFDDIADGDTGAPAAILTTDDDGLSYSRLHDAGDGGAVRTRDHDHRASSDPERKTDDQDHHSTRKESVSRLSSAHVDGLHQGLSPMVPAATQPAHQRVPSVLKLGLVADREPSASGSSSSAEYRAALQARQPERGQLARQNTLGKGMFISVIPDMFHCIA